MRAATTPLRSLLLAALRCAALPAALGAAGDARAQGAARRRSASPRPASIRRRSATCTRAPSPPHIFEAPLAYDYLARPVKLRAAHRGGACPSLGRRPHLDVRIRPGIYFADDPAFKGKKRELVAQDYVYAFKRFFDPKQQEPDL